MRNLLNRYLRHSVLREGEGGGSGGGFGGSFGNFNPTGGPSGGKAPANGGGGTQQGGGTGEGTGDDDGESEGADEEDFGELLAEFGLDDENETDDDDDKQEDFSAADQSLHQEIASTLSGMKLDSEIIPEDFDPSNRGQLMDVLNKAHRQGVGQAMRLAMRPMQVAMQRMASQMDKHMDRKIRGFQDSNESRSHVQNIATEFGDPKLSPMIKMMDDQLKRKKIGSAERAQKIRKTLTGMGMKRNENANRGNGGGNGGGSNNGSPFKTGAAALDLFAPIPKSNKR